MSSDFENHLKKYAQVAIKVGLNLQPGQRLLIGTPSYGQLGAPIEAAPLVRHLAREAYQAGARLVDVMWGDDQVRLIRFQVAPRDSFEEYPTWRSRAWREYFEAGDAVLTISGLDPDLLDGEDPDLISTVQQATFKHNLPISALVGKNTSNWLVMATPVPGWAKKLYPDLDPEDGVAAFWEALFEICRIHQDDPVANWKDHVEKLDSYCEFFNHKKYSALKLTGPGTDLKIGLPNEQNWVGGKTKSLNGIDFTPNIPTEEIFTIPHRERVEGFVSGTKPLNYFGSRVEDFVLTFSGGKVTKASARIGDPHLKGFLDTDEGARRLGEIALVPNSSPISQSGKLFFNTLFDENAASHIAIGRAYRFNLLGGEDMSDNEFIRAGGNLSLIHIDLMVGSGEMDVDGYREDGQAEPIMRGGEWVVEV